MSPIQTTLKKQAILDNSTSHSTDFSSRLPYIDPHINFKFNNSNPFPNYYPLPLPYHHSQTKTLIDKETLISRFQYYLHLYKSSSIYEKVYSISLYYSQQSDNIDDARLRHISENIWIYRGDYYNSSSHLDLIGQRCYINQHYDSLQCDLRVKVNNLLSLLLNTFEQSNTVTLSTYTHSQSSLQSVCKSNIAQTNIVPCIAPISITKPSTNISNHDKYDFRNQKYPIQPLHTSTPRISRKRRLDEFDSNPCSKIQRVELNNDMCIPIANETSIQEDDISRKCAKIIKRTIIPVEAKAEMKKWLTDNKRPYPDTDYLRQIAMKYNLTVVQVDKWFRNQRVRRGITRKIKKKIQTIQ